MRAWWQHHKLDLLSYSILAALPCAWMLPLLAPASLPLDSDLLTYFYPLRSAGMALWRQGVVPLWTGLLQCGLPLLADGQAALVYPPVVLLHLLLPDLAAFKLGVALHVVLAAAGMYLYIRELGMRRLPAIIAGWLWALAGPLPANLLSPAVHGLAWWPLFFMLAERQATRPAWKTIAAAAGVMGLSWLGGFPQSALLGQAAASLYLLWRVAAGCSGKQHAVRRVGGWAGACVLGLGLGAVQLWPTLEAASGSLRAGGADYSFATIGSMLPTGAASLLLPAWQELYPYWLAGPNLYIGLAALAACLVPWHGQPARWRSFFWLLAGLGFLLSLGRYLPGYSLLVRLPGLSFLRVPSRFAWWTVFSLIVLAARGLHEAFVEPTCTAALRYAHRLGLVLALAASASLGGSLVWRLGQDSFKRIAESVVQRSLLGQAYRVQDAAYYAAKVERMLADIGAALSPLRWQTALSLAAGLALLMLIFLWARRPGLKRYVRVALAAVCALEAFGAAGVPPELADASILMPPLLAAQLPTGTESPRLYEVITAQDIMPDSAQFNQLRPNYNALFGIPHVGAYAALGAQRYHALLGELSGVNLAYGMAPTDLDALAGRLPLLRLLGAGYVVSREPLELSGLNLRQAGPPWLYELADPLPRVSILPSARTMADNDILALMQSPEFEPAAAVLLSESAPAFNEAVDGQPAVLEASYPRENRVQLRVQGPGWLLVTSQYDPGWQALMDGEHVRIYRADYTFQAVPVAPGEHTLVLAYRPAAFARGAVTSAAALAAILAGVGAAYYSKRKAAV